jgi:hypothetical protein
MEEQKNNKTCREGNECEMCHGKMHGWFKCGHHHILLKLILGILILGFVFCLGAVFGRITAGFGHNYNRGNYYMMRGGWSREVPMMRGQWANPGANYGQPATTTQK